MIWHPILFTELNSHTDIILVSMKHTLKFTTLHYSYVVKLATLIHSTRENGTMLRVRDIAFGIHFEQRFYLNKRPLLTTAR